MSKTISYKEQIIRHVGKEFPAYSFCAGRGWKGHRSIEVAERAARRDAASCARHHGGGLPQHLWVGSDFGANAA